MSQDIELSPLIQTKLHRPRVTGELIERPRLLAYLAAHSDRPFTLISAPAGYGKTTGLKSFPSLTDDGRWLALYNSKGEIIHSLCYSDSWYGNILKSDGGWSLEMIDTDYPFYEKGNWRASVSRSGGTPGSINSVSGTNTDNNFRGIDNVFPVDSLKVVVTFSEFVTADSADRQVIKIDDRDITEALRFHEEGKELLVNTGIVI